MLRDYCICALLVTGLSIGQAVAQQRKPTSEPKQPGMEVLTRGPIHEAFAKVTLYDAKAGPIVAKEPPPAIEEIPPDSKPEGDYLWIPGYWSWDDERSEFIWVSGVWRMPPPGRAWIPGYWMQTSKGFQWVSGYWGTDNTTTFEYLPPPPQSLEHGPSSPSPGPDFFWNPGYWEWRGNRYAWRSGFWTASQDNWVWSPGYYTWTPTGCVFVDGYWDYTLDDRGWMFAPVYFSEPYHYDRPFRFIPEILIGTSSLTFHLFHRPHYGHYYFGDYYDPYYTGHGIYPWFSFWDRGYGYDGLFVYLSWFNGHHHNRYDWSDDVRRQYHHRVENAELRPERTFAAQTARAGRAERSSGLIASPISQAVQTKAVAQPIEKLDGARKNELVRSTAQVRDLTAKRSQVEAKGQAAPTEKSASPRRVDIPGASALSSGRAAESRIGAADKALKPDRLAPTEKALPKPSAKSKESPPVKPSPGIEKKAAPPVEKKSAPGVEKKPAPPTEKKSAPGVIEKGRPKAESGSSGGGRPRPESRGDRGDRSEGRGGKSGSSKGKK